MDNKNFLVGCVTAVVITLGLFTAIVVGTNQQRQAEVEFTRVCVGSNRSVIYTEVSDSLVSECK